MTRFVKYVYYVPAFNDALRGLLYFSNPSVTHGKCKFNLVNGYILKLFLDMLK